MKDINCVNCGQIIKYDDYKEQLRNPKWAGITCPHCNANQKAKLIRIEGTGKKQVVQYEHQGMKLYPKKEVYTSCPICYTYWHNINENAVCPFCDNIVSLYPIEGRFVPKAKIISKIIFNKIDFLEVETKICG